MGSFRKALIVEAVSWCIGKPDNFRKISLLFVFSFPVHWYGCILQHAIHARSSIRQQLCVQIVSVELLAAPSNDCEACQEQVCALRKACVLKLIQPCLIPLMYHPLHEIKANLGNQCDGQVSVRNLRRCLHDV